MVYCHDYSALILSSSVSLEGKFSLFRGINTYLLFSTATQIKDRNGKGKCSKNIFALRKNISLYFVIIIVMEIGLFTVLFGEHLNN